MKSRIKVKTDKKAGDGYLKLSDFKDLVDIERVTSYTLEEVDDSGVMKLILTFYDKDQHIVKAKDEHGFDLKTIDQYLSYHFKYGDDGVLRKIRRGSFNGNGLLQPMSLDDLRELAKWVLDRPSVLEL